jgi:hypothetical protein
MPGLGASPHLPVWPSGLGWATLGPIRQGGVLVWQSGRRWVRLGTAVVRRGLSVWAGYAGRGMATLGQSGRDSHGLVRHRVLSFGMLWFGGATHGKAVSAGQDRARLVPARRDMARQAWA